MHILECNQAANLAGFRASEDPRFEAGIPDFMNGILNFSIHFNVVHRKVDWRNPKMKSLNSMPGNRYNSAKDNGILSFLCSLLYRLGMWVRAVWEEPRGQQEGVIPKAWIKNKFVHWPPGVDATKAMSEMREPTTSWRKFPLCKIKILSGELTGKMKIFTK